MPLVRELLESFEDFIEGGEETSFQARIVRVYPDLDSKKSYYFQVCDTDQNPKEALWLHVCVSRDGPQNKAFIRSLKTKGDLLNWRVIIKGYGSRNDTGEELVMATKAIPLKPSESATALDDHKDDGIIKVDKKFKHERSPSCSSSIFTSSEYTGTTDRSDTVSSLWDPPSQSSSRCLLSSPSHRPSSSQDSGSISSPFALSPSCSPSVSRSGSPSLAKEESREDIPFIKPERGATKMFPKKRSRFGQDGELSGSDHYNDSDDIDFLFPKKIKPEPPILANEPTSSQPRLRIKSEPGTSSQPIKTKPEEGIVNPGMRTASQRNHSGDWETGFFTASRILDHRDETIRVGNKPKRTKTIRKYKVLWTPDVRKSWPEEPYTWTPENEVGKGLVEKYWSKKNQKEIEQRERFRVQAFQKPRRSNSSAHAAPSTSTPTFPRTEETTIPSTESKTMAQAPLTISRPSASSYRSSSSSSNGPQITPLPPPPTLRNQKARGKPIGELLFGRHASTSKRNSDPLVRYTMTQPIRPLASTKSPPPQHASRRVQATTLREPVDVPATGATRTTGNERVVFKGEAANSAVRSGGRDHRNATTNQAGGTLLSRRVSWA